jgi:hypothetical protein
MNKSKFKLEQSPKKKGDCPDCKKKGVFRYYEGLGRQFGICDRVNHCGYKKSPGKDQQPVEIKEDKTPPVKIIYPKAADLNKMIADQSSPFHTFVQSLKITPEHLTKWNCGTAGKNTAFIYAQKTKTGIRALNVVQIEYGKNGKRNKEKVPYSLKAEKGTKYRLCLFGEHLLSDKIICLVESEKTAIIASFFYPQFDWLATGGANKLTDEKIEILFGREIYYLSDADKAGKENSTIKKLNQYKQNYKAIELYPDRTDGYDLADAIIEGHRPDIKPKESLELSYKSKNLSDFDKVEIFLSERYEIRFNEVSNEIEFRPKNSTIAFEVLNENNIYIELQKNFINFSQAKVTALLRSNYVTTYNPFLDYFESLPEWDSEKEIDYIAKVTEYLPIKDNERKRFNAQFKKMLVRCIACALLPGVFNKQAFILVHEQQNSGKSTFCRWLCPPALSDYITENISTDKDSLICLSDNFIINMDELATLNKAEINTLKAMMSKDVIKVRRPYDKKPILTPRRANFLGSTNKTEFLSDETGSVRWICFELTDRLNFAYKKDVDINDVWKQAYTLFKSGYRYELTPEEIEENERANSTYQIITEEQELIQKSYTPASREDNDAFYQASDIKLNLVERFPLARISNVNIGKALKTLGFKRDTQRNEKFNYPVKGYYIKFLYDYTPNPYQAAQELTPKQSNILWKDTTEVHK